MPEILLRIETSTGQITQTQIMAETVEGELEALSRLKLFLREIHKLRKALLKIVFLENKLKSPEVEWSRSGPKSNEEFGFIAVASNVALLASYHVREFSDNGDLKTAKDHNGWHIFPDPEEAVRTLRRLLALEEPESTQREWREAVTR